MMVFAPLVASRRSISVKPLRSVTGSAPDTVSIVVGVNDLVSIRTGNGRDRSHLAFVAVFVLADVRGARSPQICDYPFHLIFPLKSVYYRKLVFAILEIAQHDPRQNARGSSLIATLEGEDGTMD